ncbi:hypothetical protein [Oryza sativa Japonica Group]|uniref:Uncharacterized protein n=1 Tax=Oryza sativa subsp. japonica TaxID=39947 RepID=Q5NBC6_ORYSJ|nr:hypothetical protein [Oryza sativa Japonica Group]BAD81230.1 hypothetical protein [Oryza sativa Japonica Group]
MEPRVRRFGARHNDERRNGTSKTVPELSTVGSKSTVGRCTALQRVALVKPHRITHPMRAKLAVPVPSPAPPRPPSVTFRCLRPRTPPTRAPATPARALGNGGGGGGGGSPLGRAWPGVAAALFGAGFVLGPLLDGIHSRVGLQLYHNGAVDVGPLHTHILLLNRGRRAGAGAAAARSVLLHRRDAPAVLGREGVAAGGGGGRIEGHREPAEDGGVASVRPCPCCVHIFATTDDSFLWFLAVFIEASAEMYRAGVPSNVEAYVLFAGAELAWLLLDGTWLGFAVACLVGTACPLAEIPLIKLFDCWSYPNADVQLLGEVKNTRIFSLPEAAAIGDRELDDDVLLRVHAVLGEPGEMGQGGAGGGRRSSVTVKASKITPPAMVSN